VAMPARMRVWPVMILYDMTINPAWRIIIKRYRFYLHNSEVRNLITCEVAKSDSGN
jgi:hypothetical protein